MALIMRKIIWAKENHYLTEDQWCFVEVTMTDLPWEKIFKASPGDNPSYHRKWCAAYIRHMITQIKRYMETQEGCDGRWWEVPYKSKRICKEKVFGGAEGCRMQNVLKGIWPEKSIFWIALRPELEGIEKDFEKN